MQNLFQREGEKICAVEMYEMYTYSSIACDFALMLVALLV